MLQAQQSIIYELRKCIIKYQTVKCAQPLCNNSVQFIKGCGKQISKCIPLNLQYNHRILLTQVFGSNDQTSEHLINLLEVIIAC